MSIPSTISTTHHPPSLSRTMSTTPCNAHANLYLNSHSSSIDSSPFPTAPYINAQYPIIALSVPPPHIVTSKKRHPETKEKQQSSLLLLPPPQISKLRHHQRNKIHPHRMHNASPPYPQGRPHAVLPAEITGREEPHHDHLNSTHPHPITRRLRPVQAGEEAVHGSGKRRKRRIVVVAICVRRRRSRVHVVGRSEIALARLAIALRRVSGVRRRCRLEARAVERRGSGGWASGCFGGSATARLMSVSSWLGNR